MARRSANQVHPLLGARQLLGVVTGELVYGVTLPSVGGLLNLSKHIFMGLACESNFERRARLQMYLIVHHIQLVG